MPRILSPRNDDDPLVKNSRKFLSTNLAHGTTNPARRALPLPARNERGEGIVYSLRLPTRLIRLSLTPCFSWVWKCREQENRFNGLAHPAQTVEKVPTSAGFIPTQIKQGVNEKFLESQSRASEIAGLSHNSPCKPGALARCLTRL